MADQDRLVGENRCWPCTVTNAVVAAVVAGVPVLAALLRGDPVVLAGTVVWALGVIGYTLYRLVARGYLPGSERLAKRTGLHGRIGPGASDGADSRRDGGANAERDDRRE